MGGTHFLQTGYLLLNRNAPYCGFFLFFQYSIIVYYPLLTTITSYFDYVILATFFNYYTICFSQRTLRFIERSPYLKGTDIPPMPSLQRNMYLLLHYFPGRLCTVQCNLPIVYIVDFSSEDFDDSIVAGMQYWQ